MATGVEERAQPAGLIAYDEHGNRTHRGREVRARRAHFVVDADTDPRSTEDAFDLQRVMLGIGVPVAGQGAGPLDGDARSGLQLTIEDHRAILLTDASVQKRGT